MTGNPEVIHLAVKRLIGKVLPSTESDGLEREELLTQMLRPRSHMAGS